MYTVGSKYPCSEYPGSISKCSLRGEHTLRSAGVSDMVELTVDDTVVAMPVSVGTSN